LATQLLVDKGWYLTRGRVLADVVEPYYASTSALASIPSTLMIVGDQELMLSETTDLAQRAAEAGANVSLTVYPGMWHVFPMYSEACAKSPASVVVEAEDALDEIARFVADEEPPTEVIAEVRARAEKDPPVALSGTCLCGSVRRHVSPRLSAYFFPLAPARPVLTHCLSPLADLCQRTLYGYAGIVHGHTVLAVLRMSLFNVQKGHGANQRDLSFRRHAHLLCRKSREMLRLIW
jgi:hypothetical protein